MKSGKVLKLLILFLSIVTIISSCQKFPVPSSENEGILIIPHEGFNNTEKSSFGYNYILKIQRFPNYNESIKLYPSMEKKFFISKPLPTGEYKITGLTAVGIRNNSTRASRLKNEIALSGAFFDIIPNAITILDEKFVVRKKKRIAKSWRQSWEFEFVDDEYKKKMIEQFKDLKNFKLWTIKNP
jgi:hypothetical protein